MATKTKREPGVFIVHGSETLNGKHVVHFGTDFNLKKNQKEFKDWDQAVQWGHEKAASMGIPTSRITLSGPISFRAKVSDIDKALGKMPRDGSVPPSSKAHALIVGAKPVVKAAGNVGKGALKVTATVLRAADRFMLGKPIKGGKPIKKRRSAKTGKKVHTAKVNGARLVSRRPIKKPAGIKRPKGNKR